MTKRNRNKKSAGRTVLFQHLKDVQANANYSGERSPHWDWTGKQSNLSQDGQANEHIRANADSLSDEHDDYQERREKYGKLIVEVYATLSPQERQVFKLLQSSLGEKGIGEELGITRSSIQTIRKRIIKKFKKFVI